MKPIEFDEQNGSLGKPSSMTDEDCSSLPCFRDGANVVSKWELSEKELWKIQKTKCIYVTVLSGQSSPPIRPDVFSPFTSTDEPKVQKSWVKRVISNLKRKLFRSH